MDRTESPSAEDDHLSAERVGLLEDRIGDIAWVTVHGRHAASGEAIRGRFSGGLGSPLGESSDDQPDWPTGPMCGDCYQARETDNDIWASELDADAETL